MFNLVSKFLEGSIWSPNFWNVQFGILIWYQIEHFKNWETKLNKVKKLGDQIN